MGRLYKREKTWWADLRDVGLGRFSLKTSDKAVAKARFRRAQLAETREGEKEERRLSLSLDQMIRSTRSEGTADSYTKKARQLCRLLGADTNIHSLRRDDILDYIETRREEVTDHTIHKELVALRQAMKLADCENLGAVPPFKSGYQPRTRWLTRAELRLLLSELDAKWHLPTWAAVLSGAEYGALCKLCWDDIDIEGGWLHLRGTKRLKRNRKVPLSSELAPKLRGAELPMQMKGFREALRDAAERAEIEHVCPSDLRRTFGSWLKQRGVDSLTVAHLMGHSSTHMVERVYGQLSESTYQAAIAKLRHAGGTSKRRAS